MRTRLFCKRVTDPFYNTVFVTSLVTSLKAEELRTCYPEDHGPRGRGLFSEGPDLQRESARLQPNPPQELEI